MVSCTFAFHFGVIGPKRNQRSCSNEDNRCQAFIHSAALHMNGVSFRASMSVGIIFHLWNKQIRIGTSFSYQPTDTLVALEK